MADMYNKAAQLRALVGPKPSDMQLYKMLDKHHGNVDGAANAYIKEHGPPPQAAAAVTPAAAQPPANTNLMRLRVPVGKQGGDMMTVHTGDGRVVQVRVPDGLAEYESFECRLPAPRNPAAAQAYTATAQPVHAMQPLYAAQPAHAAQPVYAAQPGYYVNGQPAYYASPPVTAAPPAPAPAPTIVIQQPTPVVYERDRTGDALAVGAVGLIGGVLIADAIIN